MKTRQILLTPIVKEEICTNLTFEEAINFRDALGLSSLKCTINIDNIDKDHQNLFLPGVNDITINIYQMIKKHGSKTAFVEAANNNRLEMVKVLLAAGANVNATNQHGDKALIRAARNNNLELVKYLLTAGAKINATDVAGYTALMHASLNGNLEIVKFLLENEANINTPTQFSGTAALALAFESGNTKLIDLLKSYGAQ